MPEDRPVTDKGQIPTTLRLLRLIEEVAQAGVPVSPATLADALGLAKPTVHRLLVTAETEGLIQRDIDGRSFGPGPRMRRIAGNTLSSQRVRTERLLIMKALAEDVGETCNLAVPGQSGMIYLDRVETHWPLRIQLPVGTQVPFHCTASGKLYLSSLRTDKLERLLARAKLLPETTHSIVDHKELRNELAATRHRGYSTDNEEFLKGMSAIAVPIRDREHRLLTTLSLHAPVQRQSLSDLVEHLPRLQEAAMHLEKVANE